MSAETKPKQPWTPGPWRSDYDEVDEFADVYAVGQGGNGCSLHIVDVCGPNAKADGKLMAAAPAMAEALALVVRSWSESDEGTIHPDEIAAARAALDACGWQWGGR